MSECPAGTYATEQNADGTELGLCLLCDHACSSCTGASPKDCLTCSAGHLRLLHLCVTHCPTGYYREGSQCERCDRSCELCTGAGPESCRACAPPLLSCRAPSCVWSTVPIVSISSMTCANSATPVVRHAQISARYVNIALLFSCKFSHHKYVFPDASPQGCLTCDWGSTLKDKVCYPRCEEGRYFSEKETCEPCDSSCRHCTGLRPDQCLTCHRGFALHAVERRCTRCCQAGVNDTDCSLKHTSAGVPIALLLALGLALAVFALVKAHARKKLCWGQSYERLNGSANMPHGVPEPDSGDEVDVVYTSRGGSVYRRYSFIHEQDADAAHHVDESTCLNQI
ncbi:hypothetical protein F7725_022883 [Dissostichus mawsoni]|uniref:Uncharacterized protein n=1 Tax=Dissostichus mawsoni TaxID=36200 RepID=A0A7J5Z3C7_DISMA|nr:hypothetical protein F7725_022883 [Dissostichus mawsoni]